MIYQSLPQSECCCRVLSRSRVDPSLSLKGHDALASAILEEALRRAAFRIQPRHLSWPQSTKFLSTCAELPDGGEEYSWRRRAIPSGRDTRLVLSSFLWKQSKSRLWVRWENSWCCNYKYPSSFHLWTVSQLQSKLPVQYLEDVSTSKWVAQQPACWVRSCLVSRVC